MWVHYWDRELKQVETGYDIWKDYWKQRYVSEAMPGLIRLNRNTGSYEIDANGLG